MTLERLQLALRLLKQIEQELHGIQNFVDADDPCGIRAWSAESKALELRQMLREEYHNLRFPINV